MLVGLKQVELTLRPHQEAVPRGGRGLLGALQQRAAVALKRAAVRVAHAAEQPPDAAFAGAPGQDGKGGKVRRQKQVRLRHMAEARHRRSVERDALLGRMAQLAGHDGDVFLHAEHIAKRQANELDIVFFHEPQQPVKRLFHSKDPLQNLKKALRPPW